MNPETIAWVKEDPDRRMTAFDKLANKYGQNIEAALVQIPPDPVVLAVRYQGGDPIAVIYPDGEIREVTDG